MYRKLIYLTLIAVAAFAFTLPGARPTAATVAAETVPGEIAVTVPAGGETTIVANAYCLNLGEPFPKAVTPQGSRAPEAVLKVLRAAALDGTGASNVLQTQIAIWNAVEGKWPYKDKDVDMTVAKTLTDAAAAQSTEPLTGRGVALDEAVRAGQVQVSATEWKQAEAPKALPGDAPYYGAVTLTIKNPGDKPIDVYAPLGMMLKASNEAEQDMGLYAVEQQEKRVPATLPQTGGEDLLPLAAVIGGLLFVALGWALRRG